MKKNARFAGIAMPMILVMVLIACSTGDDMPPVLDNPETGVMSEATARGIFDYTVLPTGG